ncbi:MAG: transglutaminase-like domain-containing protein [Promethearchaeota archaeon]
MHIEDVEVYLRPTRFIDSDHPLVAGRAAEVAAGVEGGNEAEVARRLFYLVRDEIPYRVPTDVPTRRSLRASSTLERGHGFCISKAVLLVALARAAGIPSRLHFADIRNHLLSEGLLEFMGTNLFVYHGYGEVLLAGQWLKVNPAFDIALSRDKGYVPVEFDGRNHAVFQPNDVTGNPHIEYVRDRGVHADVPYSEIVTAWLETYGRSAWLNSSRGAV